MPRVMEKCHCSNVKFDMVIEQAKQKNCSPQSLADEYGVSKICTACKDDFLEFCKKQCRS